MACGLSFWHGQRNVKRSIHRHRDRNPGHEWGYRAFPGNADEGGVPRAAGIVARHKYCPRDVLPTPI